MKKTIVLLAVCALVLALATAAQASAYSAAILADSPLVYYQFDETSGTDATDSTTNGNNGTYVDGVTLSNTSLAALGTAVGFDSTTNHVAVPDMGTLTEITIEVWIKPTSYPSLAGIYSTTWGQGITIFIKPTGDMHNAFKGTDPRDISSDTNLPLNSWTHIVSTMKASEGWAPNLYINGTLFGSTIRSITNSTIASDTPTVGKIGADAGYKGREYEGYMDEFAIYGSVLTPTQVQAHYDAATAAGGTTGTLIFIQ
jgi:hypothetical protein